MIDFMSVQETKLDETFRQAQFSVNLPDYMNINNFKTSNSTLISNQFNNYFSSIGKDMAAAINNTPRDSFKKYLTMNISTKFTFKNVNETQIENIIKNLPSKQSYGHDGISSILLKKLKTLLIKPITLITNQSLNCGIFPDKLKLAKITPIYKKR